MRPPGSPVALCQAPSTIQRMRHSKLRFHILSSDLINHYVRVTRFHQWYYFQPARGTPTVLGRARQKAFGRVAKCAAAVVLLYCCSVFAHGKRVKCELRITRGNTGACCICSCICVCCEVFVCLVVVGEDRMDRMVKS